MKINDKIIEGADRLCGCVVMGVVSMATQVLWHKVAEPKMLEIIDKRCGKEKRPIGFRIEDPD